MTTATCPNRTCPTCRGSGHVPETAEVLKRIRHLREAAQQARRFAHDAAGEGNERWATTWAQRDRDWAALAGRLEARLRG